MPRPQAAVRNVWGGVGVSVAVGVLLGVNVVVLISLHYSHQRC